MNQSPRVLGNRYEVGDLLGRGGMAEVHLGRDTRLGRVVAIKLLRTDLARDPVFQARFRREAQSAAGLNHPTIVAVYDTGEETVTESGGGTVSLPYIVMEYVEGRTLRDVLREGEPMGVQHALEVTGGVLAALDYSHRMGIVHRDIKPANVMLTTNGDVKVMDFGIARALADVSATMTQTQAVIGTAQYLSPEQARGETVDARSDLYSAGCLLFELMTGRPPFIADSPVAVAYQHVREIPPPPSAFNPRIPEVVDRIVLHALAKDREARYQTANDFRADLESALAGRAVAASTVAMAAPGSSSSTTEYLPQPAQATQAYGQAGYAPGAQGWQPPPGGPYDQGYGHDGRYGRPDEAPYDQQYPPGADGYARRGDRRAASSQTATRRFGFIAFALAVIALFAGAAYGVSTLVSQTNAANSQVLVPSVAGLDQKTASARLITAGLNVAIKQEPSDTVPAGQAIGVLPSGQVQRSTQVTLRVSTGAATVRVPDVAGKSIADATAALAGQGLKVNDAKEPVDGSGVPKNQVVRTDPAANTPAARGDRVTLYISSGKFVIPDVRGMTKDDAVKVLRGKGIDNIEVAYVATADQKPDTVLDQNPAPSNNATGVTKITLTLAQAPADPTGQPTDPNGQPTGQNGQPTGQNGQNGQPTDPNSPAPS